MYFMHFRSTEVERNDNYPLNRFRALFFIILLATFVCLPGCLGSIASHYETQGYTSPSKPVFVPDAESPKHAPLIDSTIKSLVETRNGQFLGATEFGWLLFDHEFQLQESALFGQRYASVTAISTIHGKWVYGARSSDLDQSLTEHHVYRLDDPNPVYSYQCSTASNVWWSGHYVLDMSGDGHSSLALLCGSEEPDHYIAFLSLRDGLVSRVEVPFKPLRAFLSTNVDGKQSINFMRSFPSVHYARDIDTPSPIHRSLDNQSASKVVLSIESTTSEENVKRYSTIERFLTPPDLNDKELLVLDAVYPGRIFLSWNFDGTLQNWWYFDLKKSFRLVSDWLDLARIRPESEDESKIAVLYGWDTGVNGNHVDTVSFISNPTGTTN